MFNCFEKQARLDIEEDIIRENGWRSQVKRGGDSVSGETTEGLFIRRSLWSRNNVGKRIDESRTTAVCLCRPRVTLNPSLIDDYRRRRASIDNRSRPTLALAHHSTGIPWSGPTTFSSESKSKRKNSCSQDNLYLTVFDLRY